jgi:hypothetical protein
MEMRNKLKNHECHGRDTSERTPECDAGIRNTQQRRAWREEQRNDDGDTEFVCCVDSREFRLC